ncbi:MAG TPA: FAD:protein FMN transferase, partial [Candidatus Dormibacteraeota bacterium]|nr:FAD:protein FMN transferase [Candidatus Dormibacteraeota bacterium]
MSISVLGIADDQALGGSVRLIVTEPRALAEAKQAVDSVLKEIDAAASRFRSESELSRLNSRAGEVVKVSPLLAGAIAAAIRGAELSDGAVDPTIGTAIRLAGYDADFASLATEAAPLRLIAQRVPGWRGLYFR